MKKVTFYPYSINDNSDSVINTCNSNTKLDTAEKEEYLKQQAKQV